MYLIIRIKKKYLPWDHEKNDWHWRRMGGGEGKRGGEKGEKDHMYIEMNSEVIWNSTALLVCGAPSQALAFQKSLALPQKK